MKPKYAILLLLASATTVLSAQPLAAGAKQSVLIVLRQPEGPVAQRLAAIPPSTTVPEEVRAVAERERALLVKAQQESFNGRLAAAGATGVLHYSGLNMVRAEVSPAMLSSLESDPAVLSLTPLSGDAQPVGGAGGMAPSSPNLGVGVQPAAGAAIGRLGHKSDAIQSPLLMTSGTAPVGASAMLPTSNPMLPGVPGPPGMAMGQMPGAMPGVMPGAMPGSAFMPQPAGFPGGSMLQSLLGVTSQMGAQAGIAMPRSAGLILLVSGGAQIAQVIAANRKPSCTISLDANSARIPAGGGQGTFVVRASPSCLWQAQSNADWLQVDTGSPAVGSGIVRYTGSPGSGAGRSGVITIAGIAKTTVKGKASVTVTQGP